VTTGFEYYGYDNCTSCKNAEGMLKDAGVSYAKREYFKQRFTVEELRALFARAGVTPREMLSLRSRPYKHLGLADRELTEDAILELMAEYPALIRRPLLISGDEVQVGFNREKLGSMIERAKGGEDA
jgi:Spx/MgsR family transcriptional regulator